MSSEPTLPPSVAETHISTVFFTADRAYKLLKPIVTPFLDHRERTVRIAAASHELELNRRMAPAVYLGTADVIEKGELVDRMVVMRRLNPADRLTARIDGDTLDADLRAVARTIAAFHASQEPLLGEDAEMADRDSVAKNWADNFEAIEPHVGTVIDHDQFSDVHRLATTYLQAHGDLFRARIDGGFVRDGHGDLTAEDIFCSPDGPHLIDCLAFDERLRCSDVLADIAFLGMDMDRLVGSQCSQQLMAYYTEFSNEHHPSSLAHHYVAYRAHVRAKIDCIRHAQGSEGAAGRARLYHALAWQHLRRGEVRLVLVGGGAGVGKSTVARGLSEAMGWMVLNSDEVRKDLAGVGHQERLVEEPGQGVYSDENTDRVYDELLSEACAILERGESVVLDASWNSERHRVLARAAAERCGVSITELNCVLEAASARERIARRMADINTPSDATPEIADYLRDRSDPWPEATVIDTGPPMDAVDLQAVGLVRVSD